MKDLLKNKKLLWGVGIGAAVLTTGIIWYISNKRKAESPVAGLEPQAPYDGYQRGIEASDIRAGFDGITKTDARDFSDFNPQPLAPYAMRDGEVYGYSNAGGQPLAPYAARDGQVYGYSAVDGKENFLGRDGMKGDLHNAGISRNAVLNELNFLGEDGMKGDLHNAGISRNAVLNELNFLGADDMKGDIHSGGLNRNELANEVYDFTGGMQGDIHGVGLPETHIKNELLNFMGGMKADISEGGLAGSGMKNELSNFAGSYSDDLGQVGSDVMDVSSGFSGFAWGRPKRAKDMRARGRGRKIGHVSKGSKASGGTMIGHEPELYARPNLVRKQKHSGVNGMGEFFFPVSKRVA